MAWVRHHAAMAAFRLSAAAAAAAPLLAGTVGGVRPESVAIAWPSHYEGRKLTEMPLTQREAAFLSDFPGHVGRFSDGQRDIIIRRVDAPTRRLHPAADCLRGAGYAITPLPARKDAGGAIMSCMRASRASDRIEVCEVIRDDKGASWPDVSQWYWSALLGAVTGPWWSYVVAHTLP
jgi:hypothetical protein